MVFGVFKDVFILCVKCMSGCVSVKENVNI